MPLAFRALQFALPLNTTRRAPRDFRGFFFFEFETREFLVCLRMLVGPSVKVCRFTRRCMANNNNKKRKAPAQLCFLTKKKIGFFFPRLLPATFGSCTRKTDSGGVCALNCSQQGRLLLCALFCNQQGTLLFTPSTATSGFGVTPISWHTVIKSYLYLNIVSSNIVARCDRFDLTKNISFVPSGPLASASHNHIQKRVETSNGKTSSKVQREIWTVVGRIN